MFAFALCFCLLFSPEVESADDSVQVDQRVVILPTFCDPNPCLNGGVCELTEDKIGSKCNCAVEWYGVVCSKQLLLLCEPNPCFNGATCQAHSVNNVTCTCANGWQGELCEDKMVLDDDAFGPCVPDPCNNRCECRLSCKHEYGYVCVSESGYMGKDCNIAMPRVSCLESEIVIDISKQFYDQFDDRIRNAYMYIAPSDSKTSKSNEIECQASLIGNFMEVSIKLPFTDCGTSVSKSRSNSSAVAFENRLWINRGGNEGFDMPVPVLDFTCLYDRTYSVMSSLVPMIDNVDRQVTRSGNFGLHYGLCKVPVCSNVDLVCPDIYRVGVDGQPAVYTVGQMIHFHINVLTRQDLLFQKTLISTLDEMFLSCNDDPFQPMLAMISAKGCPVREEFPVSLSSGLVENPQSACATFQVPRVTSSGCQTLYLHAKLRLCDKDKLRACQNDASVLYCLSDNSDNSARRRRSITQDETQFLLIGPINIRTLAKGKSLESLHLGDGYGGVITLEELDNHLVVSSQKPEALEPIANSSVHVLQILGFITIAVCLGAALLYVISKVFVRRRETNPMMKMHATSA